jgi:signal transduction histidine kinase
VKALVARDTLTPLLQRVSAWAHPRQSHILPGVVYAVFDGDGENAPFLGLVTPQVIARFPERIFADLIPFPAVAVIDASSRLDEIERHFLDQEVVALPVMEGDRFLGAVTRESLLKVLLRRERVLTARLQQLQQSLEEDRIGLARWSEQLRRLHEISHGVLDMISRTEDINALMQWGIQALTTLIGNRYGAIAVVDGTGKLIRFLHTGIDDETLRRIGHLPTGKGLLGEVLRAQQVLRLESIRSDPRHCGFPPHHPPMERLLAVPVAYHGRVLGRVYLCDKIDGTPFTDRDELLTLTFGNILASILVNAEEQTRRRRAEREASRLLEENQQFSRHLLNALEDERRYIARELHDELGQCVTAIQAEAELIRTLCSDVESRVSQCAASIGELGSRLYDGVHAMLRRLRPELLDVLGLSEAVRHVVKTWQLRHPAIRCRLYLQNAVDDVDEAVGIVVYRAVQECLTNIARHAQATAVTIRLARRIENEMSGESLWLMVKDNGKGFAGKAEGLGLIGLRERVKAIDGRLCIGTRGGGARIDVYIPLGAVARNTEIPYQ